MIRTSALPPARRIVPFVPATAAMALWLALLPAAGGFHSRDWYPAGLFAAGLLVVSAAAGGRVLPDGRAARLALGAYGLFVLFNGASVAWAESPAVAWEATGLLLTHMVLAWSIVMAPWTARAAVGLLVGFALAVGAACAIALLSVTSGGDPTSAFVENRWAEPLGYPNGTGAFAAMGAVAALILSSRRGLPAWLQGLLAADAVFLMLFTLLGQSRGALLITGITVVVALALVSDRWSFTLRALVAGGAVALGAEPALDVFATVQDTGIASEPLSEAARAMGAAAGGAGLVTIVLGLAQRRIELPGRAVHASRLAGLGAVLAVAVAGGTVALASSERISDEVSSQWRQLVDPGASTEEAEYRRRQREGGGADAGRSRLLSASPAQRYDYLRVGIDAFEDAPVVGVGAGGFRDRYRQHRRFSKYASYPHNLAVRVLAETGVVGGLIFLVFVGALGAGLLQAVRRGTGHQRTVVATSAAVAVYFAGHSFFDWIETFPATAVPALTLPLVALGVAARSGRDEVEPEPEPGPEPSRRGSRVGLAAGVALALAAIVILVPPWLSVRYRERAIASWRADPAAAYRDLDRAAAFNPLSPLPLLSEGTVALQLGDLPRARTAFEAALDRGAGWLAHFDLALVLAAEGERRAAMRQLAQAQVLNPLEPAIPAVRAEIRGKETVDPAELYRQLFDSPLYRTRRLT